VKRKKPTRAKFKSVAIREVPAKSEGARTRKKSQTGIQTELRERSSPPSLSAIDRLEGMLRHPKFREDVLELKRLRSGDVHDIEKFGAFRRRWGIHHTVNARSLEEFEKLRVAIASNGKRVFIDHLIETGVLLHYSGHSILRDEMLCGTTPGFHAIWMRVDLQYPLAELVERFEAVVKQRKRDLGLQQRWKREHQISIWNVWDRHTIEGKALLRIAQEKCGITSRPEDSLEVKREFEAVKLAYEKAQKIIELVTPR